MQQGNVRRDYIMGKEGHAKTSHVWMLVKKNLEAKLRGSAFSSLHQTTLVVVVTHAS